jgi:hypothetical protein
VFQVPVGTEAMRLTTSGYLGIGTSNPAQQFVVSNGGAAGVEVVPSGGSQGGTYIQSYNRSGSAFVPTEFIASKIGFYTGSSPSLSALLDTSGNLGLGVTPSAWGSGFKAIEINNLSLFNYSTYAYFTSNAYFNGSNYIYKSNGYAANYAQAFGTHQWYVTSSTGTAGSSVSFTQAMTLDASGNLLVGMTSYGVTNAGASLSPNASSSFYVAGGTALTIGRGTNDGTAVQFNRSGTNCGSISVTTTTTTYNTSSDQRLKTDLGQVTSTNVIDNTIIHDFVWKSDGTQSCGVFAQEAHKVIPQAVKVGDDGEEVVDQWQVDYSKYVPDLIVYCQQLKSEIQSLKAEVATLKGA